MELPDTRWVPSWRMNDRQLRKAEMMYNVVARLVEKVVA
jgi:hypothetical protein